MQIFSSAGVYLSQFGSPGTGNGQFNRPHGVAIDPTSHNIVVVDPGNNRVQIFEFRRCVSEPVRLRRAGQRAVQTPRGIAIDPTSHNIVVTDSGN